MLQLSAGALSNGQGALTWSFSSGTEVFNYLAAGESLTLTYSFSVSDPNGTASSPQSITITVNGSNDGPQLTAAITDILSGSVSELSDLDPLELTAPLSTDGVFSIADLDYSDSLSAFVSSSSSSVDPNRLAAGQSTLGTLIPSIAANTTGGAPGSIAWSYSVADSALDFLADGQSLNESFSVTVSDGNGGSVIQLITVTLLGTNDGPAISIGNADSIAAGCAAAFKAAGADVARRMYGLALGRAPTGREEAAALGYVSGRVAGSDDGPARLRAWADVPLRAARGDVARAAELAGVSRATMYRRLRAAGLSPKDVGRG
jgi:VCBS repeat-containing protein